MAAGLLTLASAKFITAFPPGAFRREIANTANEAMASVSRPAASAMNNLMSYLSQELASDRLYT